MPSDKLLPGLKAKLEKFVNELNKEAEELLGRDPLREAKAFISVDEEHHVRVTVSYPSGGGIETSCALNDWVSFTVGEGGIVDAEFGRQDSIERVNEVKAEEIPEFLERARAFLARPLKES